MNLSKFTSSVCRTSTMILTLMTAAVATPLMSQELTVCLKAPKNFDADTVNVFKTELTAIARTSGLSLRILSQAGGCQEFQLSIQSIAAQDVSALGATREKEGRMFPEIEIYVTPIATMVRSHLPALLGRGMARVAAKEIGHYILHRDNPQSDIKAGYIVAPHLLVGDHKAFQIPLTAAALARNPIRRP